MGTLGISVHHRISNEEEVVLLVLKETLDICLSMADVAFWQGLPIYCQRLLN